MEGCGDETLAEREGWGYPDTFVWRQRERQGVPGLKLWPPGPFPHLSPVIAGWRIGTWDL